MWVLEGLVGCDAEVCAILVRNNLASEYDRKLLEVKHMFVVLCPPFFQTYSSQSFSLLSGRALVRAYMYV